jgi:hypothetical protein
LLIDKEPRSWFIASLLEGGEGPSDLDDSAGWEEVSLSLLSYVRDGQLAGLVEAGMSALDFSDPLRIITSDGWNAATQDEPGYYLGHPTYAYLETIRALKASNRLNECDTLLLALISSLEAEAALSGCSLSPYYHEQLAIVRRKLGDAAGEVEVLERYFSHPQSLSSKPLRERLDKARQRLRKSI